MRLPVPGSFLKALAKALPQSFLSVIVDVMFATRDLHALHVACFAIDTQLRSKLSTMCASSNLDEEPLFGCFKGNQRYGPL